MGRAGAPARAPRPLAEVLVGSAAPGREDYVRDVVHAFNERGFGVLSRNRTP
jgi:hypothetical protein